jgi:hypothetical protein
MSVRVKAASRHRVKFGMIYSRSLRHHHAMGAMGVAWWSTQHKLLHPNYFRRPAPPPRHGVQVSGEFGIVPHAAFCGTPDDENGSVVTPNGKTLVLSIAGEFRLFETATGKEKHRFPSEGNSSLLPAISADGRLLLAGGHASSETNNHRVYLIELSSGKVLQPFALPGWRGALPPLFELSRNT